MKKACLAGILGGLSLFFGFFLQGFSQESFYKFGVTKSGLYRFDADRLNELGISSLDEVAFFGYPGRLPQKLDSGSLSLREIPAKRVNNELLIFLTGPHSLDLIDGELEYRHHYYSDTLYYLIGSRENPKRLESETQVSPQAEPITLYEWATVKGEDRNILNSGRTWYSEPVSSGSLRSIPFRQSTESSADWLLQGRVMAQSFQSSQVSILESGSSIFQTNISPIPNSLYGIKGVEAAVNASFNPANQEVNTLELAYNSSDNNATAYFEHLLLGVPNESSEIPSGLYFNLSGQSFSHGCNECEVWEVSDFYNPITFQKNGFAQGGKLVFSRSSDLLNIPILSPVESNIRTVGNWPELLIITDQNLLPEAEKLSTHKLGQGLLSEVVTLREIYDAFGYGNKDVVAIRDFIAWHFHEGKRVKNILFLGKGTFDYKGKLGGRPNVVPTYSSRSSLNPLTTYSSDDFYGLIEFGQGEWVESQSGDEKLSIGVGRLPVITRQEADIVVQKIIDYEQNPSFGNWKRSFSLFADDADNNIHLRDAEAHSTYLRKEDSEFFQNKLYLDRYEQIPNGDSQQSPEAKQALREVLTEGTLVVNYIGHGNETTLTAEEVFRVEDIPDFPETFFLPLWVTATCEFGRHDSPFIRSGAEELLTVQGKGAIGLLTTGRPVFSSVNFRLNEAFVREIYKKENGIYQDLGSIFTNTKNNSLNGALNRNFSLLGDPSLRLNYPDLEIEIGEFKDADGNPIENFAPLSEVFYQGKVVNPLSGNDMTTFNGTVEVELRDRAVSIKTLGDESPPIEFPEEAITLFRGKAEVRNGFFEGRFRVPGGIDIEIGKGNIRMYAVDSTSMLDAQGVAQVDVGGEQADNPTDEEGPTIEIQIEGQVLEPFNFPSKQLAAVIFLSDSTGIDISGIDPRKDFTIQINQQTPRVLNKSFLSDGGNYQSGRAGIKIEGLEEGINSIRVSATDLVGNSNEAIFEIRVEGSNRIQILDHIVYPNPADTETIFELTHNRPGENLLIELEVYSLTGSILFSASRRLVEAESRIEGFRWIFLQNQSKIPAKGTYIYKLTLSSEADSSVASESGKLIIE